jgi:DNA-binding LacI/PurR family transcriptional regulator
VEFVDALERALWKQRMFLVLKTTDQDAERERDAAMALVENGIQDMVVWASGGGCDRDLFARLRILGANLVFFDRMLGGPFADYVGLDNAHAVDTILRTAAGRGAKRMVFLTHAELGADSDRQRQEAFERGAAALHLKPFVVSVPASADPAVTLRELAGDLLSSPEALAVLGVNDELALLVKSQWAELDVYGIDGLPSAVQAGITTIRQPMPQMAAAAVAMLAEQQKLGKRWKARERYFSGRIVCSDL